MGAALILPDLAEDVRFFPILQAVLECLNVELGKAGGPTPCYSGFMVGDQISPLGLMDCKDGKCGGVVWVRPTQIFPTLEFPTPAEYAPCGAPTAMSIEVGVARCAPRAQGRDMYPDPQDVFNALRLYMADQAAVRRAILCCVGSGAAARDMTYSLGSWDPIPVGAGISGGTWTFTVGG